MTEIQLFRFHTQLCLEFTGHSLKLPDERGHSLIIRRKSEHLTNRFHVAVRLISNHS